MFTIGLGIALIGVASALSPGSLLTTLLPEQPDGAESLLLGARLFTYVLGMLGAYVAAIGWWLPTRKSLSSAVQPPDRQLLRAALAVILAVATGVRLYGLGSGLWFDEILMHVEYASKSFGQIITNYDSQNQHFFYTLLARLCLDLFGDTAWALRLPAAVFGVAGVAALYFFTREVGSAREALLAAALLAVAYHHVWFSQNARGYTGVLFWTLLSSWFLLRALRDRRQRWWVLYAISVALGVYTHMTMVFVIAGQVLVYVAALWRQRPPREPGAWDGALLGFPLAALLIMQLHALVLPQLLAGVVQEASVVEAWRNPVWALVEFTHAMRSGFSGSVIALMALTVFTTGLVSFARSVPAVATLLVVPLALCAAIVIGTGHHVWPRFFFFGVGFALLVVVRGTLVLTRWATARVGFAPYRADLAGVVGSLVLVTGAMIALPGVYAPKQDYQAALVFVEANRAAGDAVATVGLASLPYRQFYKTNWDSVDSVESLERLRTRAQRTWLVYTLPMHLDAVYPELMAHVRREFQTIRIFPGTLSGGAIVVRRTDRAVSRGAEGGV
jgi:uncharacterized membrane protein